MKKTLKRYLTLCMTAIFLLTVVLSCIAPLTASAAGDNGSASSARKKLWYQALKECVSYSGDPWQHPPSHGATPLSAWTSGKWFKSGWGETTVKVSPWIEASVGGKYEDGKIWCGEKDGKLVTGALDVLGISSLLQMACRYDDTTKYGIMAGDDTAVTCADLFNGDTSYNMAFRSSDRVSYLEELVTHVSFNDSVPGGGLDTLTNLEKYFAYLDVFKNSCATGSPNWGKTMQYNIVGWNPSAGDDGKFQLAGYSQTKSATTKVNTFGGETLQCSEIAANITIGSPYFNAYKTQMLQPVIDGCIEGYNSELGKIKDYRDKYHEIELAGSRFVITMSNMIAGLESGQLPKGAFQGATFSEPIVDAYNTYIDTQLAATLATVGDKNPEAIYKENAFNQLAAAAKSILANSEIDDSGKVSKVANDDDIAQAKDWVTKATEQVSSVNDNYLAINTFITSHETSAPGVKTWAYEDSDEINVACPGKATLQSEWDDFKSGLPGAPDVNGEFSQSSYITSAIESGDAEPACSDFAGSIGWIVCPTTEYVAKGTDGIYGMLKGMLDIDTELVARDIRNGSVESPTYQVWEYFRNAANTILVIIILLIIMSQLTGYGIDNYGIKKMLPRLIVAAVLINLSYIIGQLAVDISNILGNSLSLWLDSIGQTVADKLGYDWGEVISAGFFDLLMGIVALAAGTAATVGPVVIAAATGAGAGIFWMMMIPVIIGVLIALISLLMFFLMLAGRQIIVVLCVALAPVAMTLYILPNTQNLFKRYLDLFKAMLVLYPMCSLLYGLSQIVKVLVFSASGVHIWMTMIAVIAPTLPYLAAPSLLRRSLNALGNLGTTIGNVGQSLRNAGRRGQDAIQRSAWFQDAAQRNQLAFAAKREKSLTAAQAKAAASGKKFSKSKENALSRYRSQLFEAQEREKRRADFADADKYASEQAKQATRFEESDIESLMNQISTGGFTAGGVTVDSTDLGSLESALRYELSLPAAQQDYKRAAAIRRHMEKFGDDGIDAIGRVIDGKDKAGTVTSSLAFGSATRRTLDDIMSNGTIKSKARSTYETAGDLQGKMRVAARAAAAAHPNDEAAQQRAMAAAFATDYSAGMVSARLASGADTKSAKYDQLPDMTDAQFDGFVSQTDATAAALGYEAINDEKTRGRLKSGQLDDLVSQYARHVLATGDAAMAAELLGNSNANGHFGKISTSDLATLRTMASGYTSPEQAHRSKLEAQNDAIFDIQQQAAWSSHQAYAQQAGKGTRGLFPAPSGYTPDLTRPGIYTDGKGHEYNANDNTFK